MQYFEGNIKDSRFLSRCNGWPLNGFKLENDMIKFIFSTIELGFCVKNGLENGWRKHS